MDTRGSAVRRLALALLLLGWRGQGAGEASFPRQSDGEATCGRFQVNGDTIIRTQDSRLLGARYLNETELPSQRQCLAWCCQTPACNVAVFEQKDKGSCYLFDCGPSTDFKCKFTAHHHYSSAILDTGPPSDASAPDGGAKPGDEHIAALKNLKNQLQAAAIEGQKPVEADTVAKPGPTTPAPTTVAPEPPKGGAAVAPAKPNGAVACTHFQFQCRRSGECIAVYNACDGIPQCSDGSDESEDLGCPTDGRHYPGFPASSSAPDKASHIENEPQTSGQADKPRPVQVPESPHRPAPAPPRAAKNGHRGQKQEAQAAPKPNPNPQPKDRLKFDSSYDTLQGSLQNPDTRHYVHQSVFSGNSEGHQREDTSQPTHYDHAYPKGGSSLKSVPEAHLVPQTYHRQHGSGVDQPVEEDTQEPSAVARPSDKGRSPGTDHRMPASDDSNRHYYEAPPQYDAGHQEDSDSGQYGSERTNGGYAREYYEGAYAPSGTDYAQKGSHYQQQDSQYAAHDPVYAHHAPDIHSPHSKNQNWPAQKPAYDGRNPDSLAQGLSPDHQGVYPEHRYPEEPKRPGNVLDVPSDHVVDHGQGNRQDYGSDQLEQPIAEHEEKTDKYWPMQSNHNSGSQPSVKTANQDPAQAPQHQKQVPVSDPGHGSGIQLNTEAPKAPKGPPPPSRSPEPQHRVSHVELNLAEVEVTKAERTSESSGAILALTLGLSITGLMLVLVGCRLRMVRRRLRRGRSPYAHDADYLVNGMYL